MSGIFTYVDARTNTQKQTKNKIRSFLFIIWWLVFGVRDFLVSPPFDCLQLTMKIGLLSFDTLAKFHCHCQINQITNCFVIHFPNRNLITAECQYVRLWLARFLRQLFCKPKKNTRVIVYIFILFFSLWQKLTHKLLWWLVLTFPTPATDIP